VQADGIEDVSYARLPSMTQSQLITVPAGRNFVPLVKFPFCVGSRLPESAIAEVHTYLPRTSSELKKQIGQ
jgi:hypothetical protein